jgi:methylated-DNA-[protein]-cysteine S-methyltransferase
VIWYAAVLDAPCGPLLCAVEEGGALARIEFRSGHGHVRSEAARRGIRLVDDPKGAASRFGEVRRQLDEYFAGRRRSFELELAPVGTPFQLEVWRTLREIPYGETRSYGEIARRLGRPESSRAVGAANGANPIPIVIPCHRVIGADGSLTGFGGGLAIKALLLDLEAGRRRPRQLLLV